MADGGPSYHGGASDPPCYNCGIRGHWFNACPEPTRKVPAGLEASLAAKQDHGSTQGSRRGKGPVITRYPLPPTPGSSIGRYDSPPGVSIVHQPPLPPGYQPTAPYHHHSYEPPYGAPAHHYDPYYHNQSGFHHPPPPPPPGHYGHYQGSLNPYAPPPQGPPYRPPHEHQGGYAQDHARTRTSPSYSFSNSHMTSRASPPPPLPPHHYSYPSAHDYSRHYSDTPVSFHGSPPPHERQSRYSPPPYHREKYGRGRSPRGQSRDSWSSSQHRLPEHEGRYRDREYSRDRPRYPPQETSPHRQWGGHEKSPPNRSSAPERRGRQEKRRDDSHGGANSRKGEKPHTKQASSKQTEKHGERPKVDKTPRQQRQSTSEAKPPAPILDWGLVVPYMPVWDFDLKEEEKEEDGAEPDDSSRANTYEEDDDLEWTLGQLFADWVPYYQSFPISKPLPPDYSEEDIPPPSGYDDALQTEYITTTNVDQFALSIRDTKEWRTKKLLPLWTNAMDVHPRMLPRMADHDKQSGQGASHENSQPAAKKANTRQQKDARRHDDATKARHAESQVKPAPAPLMKEDYGSSTVLPSTSEKTSLARGEDISATHSKSHKKRRRSSLKLQPEHEPSSMSKSHSDGQQHHKDREQNKLNHQRRVSNGHLSERHKYNNEDSPAATKVLKRSHSPDYGTKLSPVHNSIELDTSKTTPSQDNATKNDPERPSSRGSFRSWHSHGVKMGRQASIVSELSHPDSPLTPTEMALLGIEGLDDDSESDSDNAVGVHVSATPPPPPRQRQKPDDTTFAEESSTAKSSRPSKRQAAVVDEAMPRTKKRRQQVASAFSRRW